MYLVLDTESSTFQKGNPFARRNMMCAVAWHNGDEGISGCIRVDHGGNPVSADDMAELQEMINQCTLLINFNLKYDLHWLRRYGIIIPTGLRLWDVQVVHFILTNQEKAFPSLADVSTHWGLQPKYDLIEKEYWDKGISTENVPWEIVETRGIEDVKLTWDLFLKQRDAMPDGKRVLCSLANQDLRVLAEMEWNGLRYDTETSLAKAKTTKEELDAIDRELQSIIGDHPINWNSGDHASVVLYGGTITFKVATPYAHTYKGGKKAGLTETRYKHSTYDVKFPRLVKPLPKSELAKEGYWSTSDDVLKQLQPTKKAKQIVDLLRRRSDLEKLESTYYRGFPTKIVDMDWEPGEIHSGLNQCVVVTGRLSSSGPNQQNLPPEALELVKTRVFV